jgi:hypothetical protein
MCILVAMRLECKAKREVLTETVQEVVQPAGYTSLLVNSETPVAVNNGVMLVLVRGMMLVLQGLVTG